MSHLVLVGNGIAAGGRGNTVPPNPQNGVQGTVSPAGSRVEPVLHVVARPVDDLWPAQRALLGALQEALAAGRRTDAAKIHAAILVLAGRERTQAFADALRRIRKADASGGRGNTVPPNPQNGVQGTVSPAGFRAAPGHQEASDDA